MPLAHEGGEHQHGGMTATRIQQTSSALRDTQSGQAVQIGQAAPFGLATQVGQPPQAGQAAPFGLATQVGQLAQAGQAAPFGLATQVGQPAQAGQAAPFSQAVQVGQTGRGLRSGAEPGGVRGRPWDRMLARSRGFTLDARLAAGTPPSAERLLAVRARMLVTPGRRERLARDWGRLTDAARQGPALGTRAALCRNRIIAAEADIRQLQRSLRSPLATSVRGVALASQLLADATGPVYHRGCQRDLRTAVREAISALNTPPR